MNFDKNIHMKKIDFRLEWKILSKQLSEQALLRVIEKIVKQVALLIGSQEYIPIYSFHSLLYSDKRLKK